MFGWTLTSPGELLLFTKLNSTSGALSHVALIDKFGQREVYINDTFAQKT